MNKKNLDEIFSHYIDRFSYINETEHQEYYKWQVCNEFPKLMQKALTASDDNFAKELNKVKKCTFNIIDSYTQPFAGLVECAKKEPDTVRQMFTALYSDDHGNLSIQEKLISDFFNSSNDLIDRCFPGSFLYKQNSHSVSSYLFLNDPDHHYMYKAVQSQRFADCVEFYDDWGIGDSIKLSVYHRMCDQLVEAIKADEKLLKTAEGRFDGTIKIEGGKLHPDTEKHILAFDIIYCCSVYDLFSGIEYTKRNSKEKQEFLVDKQHADEALESYNKAKKEKDNLAKAIDCFLGMISVGDPITHKKYGKGKVVSIDKDYISITFAKDTVKISLPIGISNRLISVDKPEFDDSVKKYTDILKRYKAINDRFKTAGNILAQYEEYL